VKRLLLVLALVAATVPLAGQARLYQQSAQWKISLTVVEAVTATKATAVTDDGAVLTNTGDTDGATITLMNDPVAGLTHVAVVTAAQTLTIVPSAGETLYLNGAACGVSITANAVGSTLVIRAAVGGAGGMWVAMGSSTNWTCNS
jgi:hypothetical protein